MNVVHAAYAEKVNDVIVCRLCPANCRLTEGKVGICGCRYNENGTLLTNNYGEVVTLAVDPIEKKPLYHFYPGREILSTGVNGCNLKCINCQNWSISQEKAPTRYVTPEQLVAAAIEYDSVGVAFTYTEPIIWFEYIMDCAPLLQRAGLKTVLVTNGYINPEPLRELMQVTDAMNIDLKALRPEFYKRICKGKLEPVLETIRQVAQSTVHLELTNLIIPSLNDSEKDFQELVDFVSSLSDMIPLHLSAYHPAYKLQVPSTPQETVLRAYELAKQKLNYVFVGNLSIPGLSDTRCPRCDTLLVERSGYITRVVGLHGSQCKKCGFETGIIR